MSVAQKINNMTKPTSKLRFANIAPVVAPIIASGLSESTQTRKKFISTDNNKEPVKSKSLLEFIRMYKIGNVPIMDFIIVYILLYVGNKLHFNLENQYIILSTVPITLLIDLLLDDEITPSVIMYGIIILTVFYLFFNIDIKKNTMYI